MRKLLAATVAVALGLLLAPAAGAQQDDEPNGTLRLLEQAPWVTTNQPFSLEVIATEVSDAEELELVATIHPRMRVRSAFVQSLEGRGLGRATRTYERAVTSLPLTTRGGRTLTLPLPQPGLAPGDALPALENGVYPVVLTLRPVDGGDAEATLTTYLVRLPDEALGAQPLHVTWIQPMSSPPTASAALRAEDAAAQRAVVEALAGNPNVPVTLDVSAETIAALEPTTQQALRALLDLRHPLLATTYVDVDPAALVSANRGDDLGRQRATGDEVLSTAIGASGDGRTWSIEHALDDATLTLLRGLGAGRVVVPESTVRALSGQNRTLTNPYALDAGDGDLLEAVSADEGLAAHFRNEGDPVVAAHRLLADLAIVYFDAPATAHGVVVRPPRSWRPDGAFLDAALPALATAPILAPSTLDGLIASVPALSSRGRETVRTLAPAARIGSLPAGRLAAGVATVDELVALAGPDTDEAEQARRLLLAAESARLSAAGRTTVLGALDRTVNQVRGNVRLPKDRTFRLTARSGKIPLTVVNDNPFDVRVDIVLSSDKLEFTDAEGDDRTSQVLPGVVIPGKQSLTRAIPVKTRASATFSLQAVVRAPTGQEVDRSRFTITSTAFSGVGIVLSIGAALFLALWWFRHWRTARRDRRLIDLPQ
jgi:hypothetical protein